MPAQILIKNSKFPVPCPLSPVPSKKGFTLVELMIAISIIAIIAAVGITSFNQSQKIARDSRRKQDLRAISLALQLYYAKYGHYPCVPGTTNGGWLKSGITQSNWITNATSECSTGTDLTSDFINTIPIDPNKVSATTAQPQASATGLGYGYFSAAFNTGGCNFPAGGSYILTAGLENASDPDARANKTYYYCNGTTVLPTGTGSGDFGANKFIITSW